MSDPLDDLRSATCSNGAPSARNLIVTVFGDALLPHGADVEVAPRTLATLLDGFGASERLVRTSLTRLVGEGLLANRSEGRRSFYRVADGALELFSDADRRIYHDDDVAWDGRWTIVVIDGAEATAARRAVLRAGLADAGLGTIAPNVLASPLVPADVVAGLVADTGLENVVVARAELVEGASLAAAAELAQRAAATDDLADRYGEFVTRFRRFDDREAARLTDAEAFKLRILLISTYRRIVLREPGWPRALRPEKWIGDEARRVAGRLYRSLLAPSGRHLHEVLADEPGGPDLTSGLTQVGDLEDRFRRPFDAGGPTD